MPSPAGSSCAPAPAPAPQIDYGFPRTTCISVNDEDVHGIASRRRLRRGDLVKLDITTELDGFYAHACRTVAAATRARKRSSSSAPRSKRSTRR